MFMSSHYLFATIVLYLMLATSITGFFFFFKFGKRRYKLLMIVHTVLGLATLLFYMLTYFLAPRL